MVAIRRRPIQINLSDQEHLELRHILLAEGDSMAAFFGRCAKQYIAAKRRKGHGHIPAKTAAAKPPPRRTRQPSTTA